MTKPSSSSTKSTAPPPAPPKLPDLGLDRLVVFVPTKLVNPLNAREFWAKMAKRAQAQREAVAAVVLAALGRPDFSRHRLGEAWAIDAPPTAPKRITLTAHVSRLFDDDGLQAALKAIRDGLQDCGLIHHDGPESGHLFTCAQRVDKPLGVTIDVRMRGP